MSRFYGKYTVTLDPKGRLAIPAKHRNMLPEGQQESVIITRGLKRCITVYDHQEWEKTIKLLTSKVKTHTELMVVKREFIGRAHEVEVDKQGRMSLPADLLSHAMMQDCSEVSVIGCEDYLEIWNPGVYEEQRSETEEILQKMFNELTLQ